MPVFLFKRSLFVIFCSVHSSIWLLALVHECFPCHYNALRTTSPVQWWHGKDWSLHLHVLWSGKNEDGRERWHFSECQSGQKPKALHGLHSCECKTYPSQHVKHGECSNFTMHRHSVCDYDVRVDRHTDARCHVVPIWIFVLPSLYRTSMYSSIKWWCVSWRPFKFMKILVLQWQALILHNLNKSMYFTYFILCSSCVLYSWHTYVCHSNHDDFVHTVLISPQCRELP